MNWRAVLALIAVSLLVLPLLLLVFLWSREPAERVVEGWRFIPWVTPGETRDMRTLRQPCQDDAQCDPGLVCFNDPIAKQRRCASTSCDSDDWCAPYGVCRAVPLPGRRVALRKCVVEGTREEGEQCLRLPTLPQRDWACGKGLVCAGAGWCGRRCIPGREGTCPEGCFCARGDPEGPVCQPTCEGRTCPEGQECVRREGGVSVCALVQGRPCHTQPCTGSQVCETYTLTAFVGEGWRRCVQPCGQDGAGECPKGFRCHQGRCRRPCVVAQPNACGVLTYCVNTDNEGNGVCLFSPEEWDLGAEPAQDGG